MSVTVDQVIQRYTLDNKFSGPADRVRRDTLKIGRAQADVTKSTHSFASTIGNLLGGVAGQVAATVAALAAAATGGIAALGVASIRSAADMDSLMRALVAVTGSTAEAEAQFARLKKVAEGPGLGVKEAVQGSLALQGAGMSAKLAEEALRQFGNAIAVSGGGKEQLGGVITALAQIQARGEVTADNINQIANSFYGVRNAMKAAFGTADSEELQKMGVTSEQFVSGILVQLAKMPRATGGIQNGFDNLGDAVEQAMAQGGKALSEKFMPLVEQAVGAINSLVESGAFREIGEAWSSLFSDASAGDVKSWVAVVAAALKNIPLIIKAVFQDVVSGIRENFAHLTTAAMEFIAGIKAAMTLRPLEAFKHMQNVRNELGSLKSLFGTNGMWDRSNAAAQQMAIDIYRNMSAVQSGSTASATPGPASTPKPSVKPIDNMLEAIKRNTAATAANTQKQIDMTRYALGGGDIAALGVTPVEVRRARSGGSVEIRVSGADESLNKILAEMLRKALPLLGGRA